MTLVWTELYTTGVASIDRQHQKLFEYINKLDDLIKADISEGTDVDDLLNFLTEYVLMHFSHEEFCMKQVSCPAAEKNKKAHDDFVAFFNDFKNQYKAAPSKDKGALLLKLQKAAEDWLKNHICKIDIQLRSNASALR